MRMHDAMNVLHGEIVLLMRQSMKEQRSAENMDASAGVTFAVHRARMTERNRLNKSAKALRSQAASRLTEQVSCLEAARLLLRVRADEVQSVQSIAAVTKAVSGGCKSSELGQFKSVEIRPAFKENCRFLCYDGNGLAIITGRSGRYATAFDAIDAVGGCRKLA